MSTTSLLRQSLMAQEKKEKQDSTTSMLRRSLEVDAGVAPGTFSPTNKAVPETPQRIYKPGAKAYAPTNLRSLAESTIAPASSQEQTAPKYVSPFAKNEDYAELSRYKSTKNGKDVDNRNFIDKAIDWIIGASDNENSKKYSLVNGYTTEDYDDELYEYINRNPDVVSRVNTNEATSGQYFSGVDQSFLQEMEDAEIADYNYLYATQGKDKANEFLQNLKKDLTKRQMDKYVAENQQYARENPVAASTWSVLSKPLEAVGLAGQLMDYKLDRDVDSNAGYNRFAKQNRTIRQTVPENWSKAGQFLYGTGMSILDNVYNMALVGAFGDIGGLGSVAEQVTLGLMSSSAASESVLESLEDGYSADRAIIQGALAGAIEYLTEKISWGALMEPNAWKDGTIKYILKNARQEGLEEGISTVANWGVDLIGDIVTDENRSDLREVFTDYKDGNYKAMWGKLRDMGIDVALDVAGGALSGGVLAGGGSLFNLAANTVVGRNANANYSQSQIGKYVQESFNDTVGNKDASDYQQSLAKKAMNQFDQNGKVSNRTLGELMQSNAYMESERIASNNLLAEAMDQINSGKTVSDSTVKQILDDQRAVDFLSRNSGLQLQDNMTRPERFQAVRNSLNQTIQQIDEVQAPARKVVSEIRQQNELYKQKTDMISEFAKTLGEQGGRTLMHMAANEDLPNITSLAGAYTKVYNEVKANPEVNLNEVSDEIDNRFTPSQLYSVYQAAVSDREADFKENGVPYEGETTNGRSEDNGGNGVGQTDVDSGVGVESLSRWARETEKGNPASERARIIAKNQAAVSGQPKVTAQEAGFANGSNRDEHRTTQVVPEDNWASLDEDTYSFFKELKSQGYNVIGYVGDTFFEDPLSTNDRGEHPIVTMRGFIRGKTIGVRVDAELSSRQIIMHELFHGMVASDSALQGRMLDKLNDKYKGRMDRVFQDYVSHYEWMLPEDATPEQIEEWTNRVYNEILADAYAGIEPLRYTMNYRTASQFTEDVREMVSGNGLESDANGTRAGPAFSREESSGNDRTADSDTQYSIDSFFNAAGMNATLEGGRVVVYDDFGNRVNKVTVNMVRNSGIGAMINFAASDNALRKATITKEEANKQIQGATDLLNLMLNAQDGELVWRFSGSAVFSAVKTNADGQYTTTIDFTTVCRKTQDMMTALSNAMLAKNNGEGGGLTKEEVIELQKDILEEGGTVPCPVCYVFSRWAGIGGILDNMNKWQNKYGHEYDDPEVLRARMEELQRATKTKKDLRAFLKEHDSEYNSMAGEKEYLQTERRKLKGRLRRKGLTAAEIKELNERVNAIDTRLEELKKDIENIEKSGAPELAWLTRVRSQAGYWDNGFVPKKTLFNLDDAATFAEKYTLAWKYRTSRGPSAGKAILPYSDMRLGAMILGPGRNPAQNDLFKKVGAEFNKAQTAEINKAIKRVLAQNLIGGQRFQSTSDFRYDYALDYLMAFWECQALGSKMQTYTKIVEFAELAATVGGDVNLSVMPLEKGYINGKSGSWEDGRLVFSSVTGMDIEAASKANAMFDNVQLILVGINDEHIKLALRDDPESGGNLIGFVIPYHASGASINQFIRGLVENLGEDFNEDYYKDYSPLQNDVVIDESKAAEHLREIRRMILRNEQTDAAKKLDDDNVGILTPEELDLIRGTSVDISDRSFDELLDIERRALRGDKKALAEYRSWSAGILWDIYNKMRVDKSATETYGVELNSEQSKIIMPHEYWNKTVDRDHAYVNGFIFRSYCNSLGLAPRFTGINNNGKRIDYGDFSDEPGYWKTLIDRPMYKNDGTYRDQQALNVTNVTNEMLTPEYGEKQWGAWKVAEPSEERAKRAAQRFTERHSHFSRDTDYMEAVNSGDMDTAQRMVDEAAKDAGYVLSVYHGTGEYFNTFMMGDEGIHLGNEEQAKQLAKSRYEQRSQATWYRLKDVKNIISSMDAGTRREMVESAYEQQDYSPLDEYAPEFDGDINNDKEVLDYINRILERDYVDHEDAGFYMRTFDRKTGERVMHLYAKISNPFVINGDITEWFPSEIASVLLDRSNGIETRERWDGRKYSIGGSPFTLNDSQTERLKALTTYKVKGDDAWDSLAEIFSELGFDGIQYLNQYEGDKNSDSFIALHPSDVKSADPVTYDDQGNIIPLSERFNAENNDIRYSRDTAPEFYSKLEREIEGYKGEKLGAASVTSYLKGKGVKDEEIKWTGIATFLEGKKSVSKAELLQYVRDNQIQIEEQDLTIEFDSNSYSDYEEARDTAQNEAIKILEEKGIKAKESDIFVDYDADEGFVAYYGDNDEKIYTYNPEKLSTRWGQFKTPGGENYREILYKIPGSDYSNDSMNRHWGETGVLAHARIQDIYTIDGKILFVDEIQSDWHNAGQSGAYIDGSTKELADKLLVHDVENRFFHDEEARSFVDRIYSSRGRLLPSQYTALYQQVSLYRDAVKNNTEDGFEDFYKGLYNYELTNDDKALINKYIDLFKEANENESLQREILKARKAAPDAPFRNGTYIQYVLKDLLRKAAEGGYDYLAWTTGQMQEDRWSSEYAEGYRIEYDQDIPKFLSKYGKQWGAKPTQVSIENPNAPEIRELGDILVSYEPDLASDIAESLLGFNADSTAEYYDFSDEDYERASELTYDLQEALSDGRLTQDEVEYILRTESSDVPAIPITDAMKESVLYEGQPRFSRDTTGMESELQKQNRDLNRELKEVTERYHYFKDQLVLTKVRQATEQSANRVAKQLVKDYSSNVSADEIAKALREASKLVLNVKDDTDIDELQTQLKDALRPYAMQMVTNASELINAEDVETQKSIRNDLRNGTGIIVTEQMKKDVPDWASFRKAQFGNMKLVSGPKTNIHDVYLELSQKYGEGYFPADVANESDMLQVIADVMADLSAIYDNPYTYGGANIAEAIESCTNDMMMSVVGSLEAEQPTFADKEKAKRDALRKQAIEAKNAALQRVREQRDDALAKQSARYKDRIDSIYRKRKQYEYRGKIRKKSKDLSTLLLRPTDKRHIPYELQGVVLEVLNRIDTGSSFDFDLNNGTAHVPRGTGMETGKTNAFLNLKKQLSELKNHLVLDPSLFDSEDGGTMGMLSTLSGLESRSIDDMDLEQLDAVYTVLRNVENLVRKYNKALKLERFETISEAATAIFDENGNKTSRDEYVKGIEDTINLLAVDSLTPQAYFHRLGKSGDALFKMLRAAQDDNIRILREAQKFSEDHGLYKLKLKKYERELVTVRFGNRDVEMSKAQLMELYVLNKRDASRMHLEVGGILPEPVQRKRSIKKVTYSEAIHNITQEDIAKAMTQLSAEDIALADAMQEFLSKTISKHGNDASMRVYGYKKFGEENYWPIRVNDQELKTELGKAVKQRRRTVSQMGFTIAIKPNAKQSVFIGSIFDTFSEHVAEMATYSSYLDVMEDLNRIYNFNEKDESGAIDMSTKLVLRKVLGPKGETYFTKLAEDIANPVPATPTFLSGLIGKFKAAAVGSNLRVIIQQPTAIFRAMSMIDPKYLAIGIAKFRKGASKAVEKAPIAQWKEWGYFDISTGRSVKNILFENSSTLDRAQNLLMAGAGKADSVAWGALYSAVEAETKDLRPDLDPRSKEFDDVVVERFSDIIDQTQVVDGVLQRSHLMRSENWLDKTATSFMAEPTKQLNMMMTAVYDLVHGENKGEATRTLARTTGALLFAGVLNAAVQSIVDAIRNDDPEKDYWEKFLAKFTGDEATFAGFLDSNLGDFLNPMQYVTYAKDIYSLFQGFEVERMDTSLIKSVIKDGKSLVNAFNGKGKYSLTNNLINFINTTSKFFGLSVSNVKRDVAGIANTIAQETGSYVFEYRMSKFTYNLNQATNKGRFVEILAKAYETGDREAFNIIMNDLIKEDKFATTTMTTEEWIKKWLKDKHQIILK